MDKTAKAKAAEEFLESLEDPKTTMDVMLDRIDPQMLHVINNYAELISKVKKRTELEQKDITTCSMIIGFLLAGHCQRADLQESLKLSLGE
jgi:hypothetical protein